jgi:isopentenyl phosphate kinase
MGYTQKLAVAPGHMWIKLHRIACHMRIFVRINQDKILFNSTEIKKPKRQRLAGRRGGSFGHKEIKKLRTSEQPQMKQKSRICQILSQQQ